MAPPRVSNERTDVLILPLLAALLASAALPADDPPAVVPGPAGLEVLWKPTWDEAAEAARKIPGGRILIYFADDGCTPCQRMEALVVPSTSFFAFTRDKVPLYLKISTPEGKKLAERLRVAEIPAWVLVTPDLLVTGRQTGPTSQMGWIQAFVEAEKEWAGYRKLVEQEAANPADPALVFEVARESFRRCGDSLAEPRFARLAEDSRTPSERRESALAYLASIQLDSGRVDEAAATLDRLLALAKDPLLKQRAQLRRAEVEIARGRRDLAVGRLRTFRTDWPDSPLLPDVDRLLEALAPPSEKAAGSPK